MHRAWHTVSARYLLAKNANGRSPGAAEDVQCRTARGPRGALVPEEAGWARGHTGTLLRTFLLYLLHLRGLLV